MSQQDKDDILLQHEKRVARNMKIGAAIFAAFIAYTAWYMLNQ